MNQIEKDTRVGMKKAMPRKRKWMRFCIRYEGR